MVPRQPRDTAIIGIAIEVHPLAVPGEVVEQRTVRDRDAVGKTGRAAGILQVADRVGVERGQLRRWRRLGGEAGVVLPAAAVALCRGARHCGDFGRVEQRLGVRAAELDGKLVDVIVLAAKAGRQGQRYRPDPGIDRPAEQRGEFGAGFGNQREAVARREAGDDQAAGHSQRIAAQFAERVGAGQAPARIVEIEPARTAGGIVQRLGKGGEIGEAARQGATVGRGDKLCGSGFERGGFCHPIDSIV